MVPTPPLPARQPTEGTAALSEWLAFVKTSFLNRFFGAVVLAVWPLLYFSNLWSYLPTVEYQRTWALSLTLVAGSIGHYSLARDRVKMVEALALRKLRQHIVAELEKISKEAKNTGVHFVTVPCHLVNWAVRTMCYYLLLGALSLLTFAGAIVYDVIGLPIASICGIIGKVFAAVGFGAGLLGEMLVGAKEATKATAEKLLNQIERIMELAVLELWGNRGKVLTLVYAIDMVTFNIAVDIHLHGQYLVQQHPLRSYAALSVLLCMVVASWKSRGRAQ